jgi:hypothetical protein
MWIVNYITLFRGWVVHIIKEITEKGEYTMDQTINQNDIIKQLMNRTPTKEEKARKELALKNAHPLVRDAYTSQNLQKAKDIMNQAQTTSDMARNTLIGIMIRSSSSIPEISLLAKQIQDATKNILAGKNIVEYSMCHMSETKETLESLANSNITNS